MGRTDKPKQCDFCNKYTHTGGFMEDNNCDYCGKDLDTVTFEGVKYNLAIPEEEAAWYKAGENSVKEVFKTK